MCVCVCAIGLRENLLVQETIDFPIEIWGFPVIHPLNQPIESWNLRFPGYEAKKPKAREKVQASEG